MNITYFDNNNFHRWIQSVVFFLLINVKHTVSVQHFFTVGLKFNFRFCLICGFKYRRTNASDENGEKIKLLLMHEQI